MHVQHADDCPRRAGPVAMALLAGLRCRSRPRLRPRSWNDIELIDGRVLPAIELRANAVVAQIWASWCPFCGAQNPHVQKLYNEQVERGLRVVAFSIDRTVQAARDYVATRGYTFPVTMATPQLEQWFGKQRALPETYVVNRAGDIVFTHRGEMFPEEIAALARFAGK
jgi:thiol-disulfide isomerase/thioredoxin